MKKQARAQATKATHPLEQQKVEPTMTMALAWYTCDIFNKFAMLNDEQVKAAVDAASAWSLEYPLWMREEGKKDFPQRDIPGFGKKSSIYAIGIMAASVIWAYRDVSGAYLTAAVDSGFVQAAKQGYQMYKMGMK